MNFYPVGWCRPCAPSAPTAPARKQYTPVDALATQIVRGDDADQERFLKYYAWALAEIEHAGEDLELLLEQAKGQLGDEFTAMVNEENCSNRCMFGWDKLTNSMREGWWKLWGREGGYPIEKGRDIISLRVQAFASYATWVALQAAKAGSTLYIGYRQFIALAGDGSSHNATSYNTTGFNSTAFNSTAFNGTAYGEPAPSAVHDFNYDLAVVVQTVSTILTLIPYVVHSDVQWRDHIRLKARGNTERMSALVCLPGAIRFMTEDSPTPADANDYRIGLANWGAVASEAVELDVRRGGYAVRREVFFAFTFILNSLTGVNLARSEPFLPLRVGGAVQALGGAFATVQLVFDILQGHVEVKSAEQKLGDLERLLKKILKMPGYDDDSAEQSDSDDEDEDDRRRTSPARYTEEDFWVGIANSAYSAFHRRLAEVLIHEMNYGRVRIVKGSASIVPSLAAVGFGLAQIIQSQKAPPWATIASALGSINSLWYYIGSFNKLETLRNGQKTLEKTLYLAAQFFRINYDWRDLGMHYVSGKEQQFKLYQRMFQSGQRVRKREAGLHGNEFLFLDLATAQILDSLNPGEKGALERTLNLPIVEWMQETERVPALSLHALLLSAQDKAPVYRTDFVKQGLATLLKVKLPVSKDKMEKRVKPSLLVNSRLRLLKNKVPDGGSASEGEQFKAAWKVQEQGAAAFWARNQRRLLRGVSLEEFIASVLDVYDGLEMPAQWTRRHCQMAALAAVAEYALESRQKCLDELTSAAHVVVLATEFGFSNKEIERLENGIRAYAGADILNRGEQRKRVNALARDPAMQTILEAMGHDDDWLQAMRTKLSAPAREGLKLLRDRVDRHQVINTTAPEALDSSSPAALQSLVTLLPHQTRSSRGNRSRARLQEVIVDGRVDGFEVDEEISSTAPDEGEGSDYIKDVLDDSSVEHRHYPSSDTTPRTGGARPAVKETTGKTGNATSVVIEDDDDDNDEDSGSSEVV